MATRCLWFAIGALLIQQGAAPAAGQTLLHRYAEHQPGSETYHRLADELERHWKGSLLPCWFPRAVDRTHGGFYPHFLEDWSRGPRNEKTLVYQSRMTWVAAQIVMRYPDLAEQFRDYTRHGLELLDKQLWDSQEGGLYWGLDESGQPKEPYGTEKHVYGLAFAIYAASAAYEATRDAAALDLAQRTFRWLDKNAHDAKHGGYFEALERSGKPLLAAPHAKRQVDLLGTLYGCKSMNSHIHLLEALAALHHVWPDPLVKQRLAELLALVRDKIAVEPGCLNLFFTPDWRALPDHDSFGHDVETAYLLIEAARELQGSVDPQTLAVARQLVDHALQWGWDDKQGGFYDKGAAFAPAWGREKVWWTQAEGLNALLLMHEQFGSQTPVYFKMFLRQWDFIWNRQVDHLNGGWYAGVDAEGLPKPGQAKATIWKAAYHDGRALMNCVDLLRKMEKE